MTLAETYPNLSEDYKKAWKLIQKGSRLICLVYVKKEEYIASIHMGNSSYYIVSSGFSWGSYRAKTEDKFLSDCRSLQLKFMVP